MSNGGGRLTGDSCGVLPPSFLVLFRGIEPYERDGKLEDLGELMVAVKNRLLDPNYSPNFEDARDEFIFRELVGEAQRGIATYRKRAVAAKARWVRGPAVSDSDGADEEFRKALEMDAYSALLKYPVLFALDTAGEAGSRKARNTFRKFWRLKGSKAFCDTVWSFRREVDGGEDVGNRGAALTARLKSLPDAPGGGGDAA